MRVPGIVLLLVICLVTGCATISTNPAVPAFSNAVATSQQAFEAARSAENEAFAQAALNAALASGTVSTENCWQPDYDPTRCQIIITVDGHRANLRGVASNGAKLAQALTTYAQGLAQLASATDIADQQTAIHKLTSGLDQIATLLSIPGVTQVGNFIAEIQQDMALKNRQAQVLAIAQQYDSTFGQAADLLQSETQLLQKNVISNASQTVEHLEVMLATAPADQRRSLAQSLVGATEAEQQAASLKIELASQLKAAHAAMITSLRNPSTDPTAALKEIETLARAFSSMETAFSGTAATPTRKEKRHD